MHPRRPNPAPQSRGRVWVAVCGNPAAAVEQPAPKLLNLVFQALQRVFESDSYVDYVCSPELEERSGDMKRSEFHPAAQNCMKIPWRRDQTKVGGGKIFSQLSFGHPASGLRYTSAKIALGTRRFQRAGVESRPIVEKRAVGEGCARECKQYSIYTSKTTLHGV